jgi:hypothetical protein
VGGRKPAWNLKNESPDREWRPGSIIFIPEYSGQGLSGSPSGSLVRTFTWFVLWHFDPRRSESTNQGFSGRRTRKTPHSISLDQ